MRILDSECVLGCVEPNHTCEMCSALWFWFWSDTLRLPSAFYIVLPYLCFLLFRLSQRWYVALNCRLEFWVAVNYHQIVTQLMWSSMQFLQKHSIVINYYHWEYQWNKGGGGIFNRISWHLHQLVMGGYDGYARSQKLPNWVGFWHTNAWRIFYNKIPGSAQRGAVKQECVWLTNWSYLTLFLMGTVLVIVFIGSWPMSQKYRYRSCIPHGKYVDYTAIANNCHTRIAKVQREWKEGL